jgi:NAD-dependent deacetylase
MVVVGTSLAVSPANLLPVYAKQNGALMIEVNPNETPMSSTMDLSLRSFAAKALPELVGILS